MRAPTSVAAKLPGLPGPMLSCCPTTGARSLGEGEDELLELLALSRCQREGSFLEEVEEGVDRAVVEEAHAADLVAQEGPSRRPVRTSPPF